MDGVSCAIVLPLFGAGPVVAEAFVCSLTKTIMAAMKNPSRKVSFDERIIEFSGVSVVG